MHLYDEAPKKSSPQNLNAVFWGLGALKVILLGGLAIGMVGRAAANCQKTLMMSAARIQQYVSDTGGLEVA
jgi:hypothetical protein